MEEDGEKFVAIKRPMRRTNGAWGHPMTIGFLREKYVDRFHVIHACAVVYFYFWPADVNICYVLTTNRVSAFASISSS